MMKQILMAIMFSMILIGSFSVVLADPPGTGTVTQITDVSIDTTMYMGKQYYVKAIAKDVVGAPVQNTACAIHSTETSTGFPIDREHIKDDCLEDKTCLPAANLPFECYYTTWGSGVIMIPFYIDPLLYNTNTSYTFYLTCEDITVNSAATVYGVSDWEINGAFPHSCNVETVKIEDGTNSTTDYFDENPNKLDTLNISFSLDSFNTVCVGEKVRYKINRDINGSWVGQSGEKEIVTGTDGTGVIPLEIDGSYFVGGTYQVVVMADDKQDDANFTVATMRPMMEGYETADWVNENMSGLIMWVVLLMALIFAFLLLRAVMR